MKKEVKKEFIRLNLSDIKPYKNNPRINDDAVADVMESIKQCHDLDPIEIDENNVILSDHTRLKALTQLGYKEADCLRYTGLTDAQKRKYRLLANKTSEIDDLFVDEYYRIKSHNAYTQEQIQNKRKSLEGVLVPIMANWNENLLQTAGFKKIDCFYRCLNFAGWIAIK